MFNMRYHIASLVSVFLALSVGLLLGSIVNERGALDAQRDSLVSSLREQYEAISSENNELSTENDTLGSFATDTLPVLIDGELAGKTVAVFVNTGRADGLSAVRGAITAAGGVPVTVTFEKPKMGLEDSLASEIASGYVDAGAPDALSQAAVILANEWASPLENRPFTEALVEANVLSVDLSELPASVRIDGVVILAVLDDEPDMGAFEVARALVDHGVPGVGAEVESYPTGVAEEAVNRGLSAVDHLARPQGVYSLVMILSDKASGYFGVGPAAGAAYPVIDPTGVVSQ